MVSDGWRRYIETGKAFSAMTVERAEELLKEAISTGEVKRQQVQELLDLLTKQGKQGVDTIVNLVKQEALRQWQVADSVDKDFISSVLAGMSKWLRPPCPEGADTASQSSTVKVSEDNLSEESAKEESISRQQSKPVEGPTESSSARTTTTAKKPGGKVGRNRSTSPKSGDSSGSRSKSSSVDHVASSSSNSSDPPAAPLNEGTVE
jgi:polyhydroxyalkanoate synthesis regulator phasin